MIASFQIGRAAIAVAAVALVLSACAAPASDVSSTDADAVALLPEAEGTTVYPLTVETAWGEVTIPERPERVVAGDLNEFAALVELGVTPVAWHNGQDEVVPWADDVLVQEGAILEWGDVTLPPEEIAATEPDLILATSFSTKEPESNIDQVSAIAPVLAPPVSDQVYANWRDVLPLLGEVLDLQDRAQQVIDEHDAYFPEFRRTHPEIAGKTVAVLGFDGSEYIYYGNATGSDTETFYTNLGFVPNPDGERFVGAEELSPELVGQIEADVVIVTDRSGAPEEFEEFIASPVFQQLDAAKNGRVIALENWDGDVVTKDGVEIGRIGHPLLAVNDPVGSPRYAEILAPLLAEVLAD